MSRRANTDPLRAIVRREYGASGVTAILECGHRHVLVIRGARRPDRKEQQRVRCHLCKAPFRVSGTAPSERTKKEVPDLMAALKRSFADGTAPSEDALQEHYTDALIADFEAASGKEKAILRNEIRVRLLSRAQCEAVVERHGHTMRCVLDRHHANDHYFARMPKSSTAVQVGFQLLHNGKPLATMYLTEDRAQRAVDEFSTNSQTRESGPYTYRPVFASRLTSPRHEGTPTQCVTFGRRQPGNMVVGCWLPKGHEGPHRDSSGETFEVRRDPCEMHKEYHDGCEGCNPEGVASTRAKIEALMSPRGAPAMTDAHIKLLRAAAIAMPNGEWSKLYTEAADFIASHLPSTGPDTP